MKIITKKKKEEKRETEKDTETGSEETGKGRVKSTIRTKKEKQSKSTRPRTNTLLYIIKDGNCPPAFDHS